MSDLVAPPLPPPPPPRPAAVPGQTVAAQAKQEDHEAPKEPLATAEVPAASGSADVATSSAVSSTVSAGKGSARGGGQAKKVKAPPSILGELGIKFSTARGGLIMPESRWSSFQRFKESKNAGDGAIVPVADSGVLAAMDGNPKKKRKQSKRKGVRLDDAESLLFSAAHCGNVSECRQALGAGANVNVCTNADLDGVGTGCTALHVAAAKGHDEVATELLKAGAQASAMSGRGEVPLQVATRNGHVGVVQALRQYGGVGAMDAEGAMQLLRTAPAYDDKRRRQLQSALGKGKGGKGGKGCGKDKGKKRQREHRPPPPIKDEGVWATD